MTDITIDHDSIDRYSVPEEVKKFYTEVEKYCSENGVALKEITLYTSEYGWQLGDLTPSENECHDINDGFPIE